MSDNLLMVLGGLFVGILLIFQFFYRKKLRKDFLNGNFSESTKREFGQVTGLNDAKKSIAIHGLVVNKKTGHYFSQHRHPDSVLTRNIT